MCCNSTLHWNEMLYWNIIQEEREMHFIANVIGFPCAVCQPVLPLVYHRKRFSSGIILTHNVCALEYVFLPVITRLLLYTRCKHHHHSLPTCVFLCSCRAKLWAVTTVETCSAPWGPCRHYPPTRTRHPLSRWMRRRMDWRSSWGTWS